MTEIYFDGIEGNERDQIETDIKEILKKIHVLKECPIKRIIVTVNFTETVKKYITESSRDKKDYNKVHEYGVAFAKVIPEFQTGKISFNLILDRIIFQRLDSVGRLDRMGLFHHELVHMVDDELQFDSVGEKKFRSPPKTKKEGLFNDAWVIWQEYHAEREVFETYEKAFRNEKISYEYTPKLSHFKTLEKLLSSLPKFLQENIMKFRKWQLTPEEVCRLIQSRVTSILVLYSYLFALSDAVTELKDKIVELSHLNGYRFFSEDLQDIHNALLQLYEKNREYNPELVIKIGDSIDSILMKCGLEIKDAPQGYYIEIHDVS